MIFSRTIGVNDIVYLTEQVEVYNDVVIPLHIDMPEYSAVVRVVVEYDNGLTVTQVRV